MLPQLGSILGLTHATEQGSSSSKGTGILSSQVTTTSTGICKPNLTLVHSMLRAAKEPVVKTASQLQVMQGSKWDVSSQWVLQRKDLSTFLLRLSFVAVSMRSMQLCSSDHVCSLLHVLSTFVHGLLARPITQKTKLRKQKCHGCMIF